MPKRGMGRLLDRMLSVFDHEIGTEDVRVMVEEGYHHLACQGALSIEAREDLGLLGNLLAKLGWKTYGNPAKLAVKLPSPSGFKDMSTENCFVRGALRLGCGRYLDALSSTGEEADASVESLLRHVEVKRQRALRKFTRELADEAQWLERCDVSILFSRFARRRHDLRFLNAAFKMNEWYLKEIRGASGVVQARQLVALAEQELSAQELLAC